MTAPFQTQGLSLEQAPPLEVPAAFFLTAPLAIMAAGLLFLWEGSITLVSGWVPVTLASTHLGTLGLLTMVMMGALYQMIPVVAGSPVPRIRLAHAVHALFAASVAALLWGLATTRTRVVFAALAFLFLALVIFLAQAGHALARAPTRGAVVTGMRLAVACLCLAGFLGLWMAHGFSGMRFPGPRALWIQVHLTVGLLGWVGGLITAVSWQVIPMFYLADPPRRGVQRASLVLLAAGVLLPVTVLGWDAWTGPGPRSIAPERLAAIAACPAALVVWGSHPLLMLRSLARRRRRRRDASLLFWTAGLAAALLTGLAALAAHLLAHPHWTLLFGWLAIWGWAGMILHGMLGRIVPFLVWFHRWAPLVGRGPTLSTRKLLPDPRVRLGFGLHLASVLAGAAAILSGQSSLVRLTGLLLLATGAVLACNLLHVLRQRPDPARFTRPIGSAAPSASPAPVRPGDGGGGSSSR